jgi:uncharacterized protein (DUF1015 family)
MISLRPFRAWRPAPDKAPFVGSRSYVSYSEEELAQRLAENSCTFLHVIHPQETEKDGAYSREDRFRLVRNAFQRFCSDGIMIRDQRPCIYVYEQRSHGNTSRGIITGVSVRSYTEGVIKVHEQTLTAREQLFTEYLKSTGINAEPVLLTTPPGARWDHLLAGIIQHEPEYDFITRDGVQHRLWVNDDPQVREELQKTFGKIPSLYIADGHHRLASSARLAQEQNVGDVDPEAWCLAYIVPHDHLYIYNFDRTVTDLGSLSEAQFLERLSEVGKLNHTRTPRSAPGIIAVRTKGGWHSLELPPSIAHLSAAEKLDAARLSQLVLGPILGVNDLRTDPRICFIPGTEGVEELDRLVSSGNAAVAFHLHPVSFSELRAVADEGGTMPPKSTYIEPKLRSGITVYSLEDV